MSKLTLIVALIAFVSCNETTDKEGNNDSPRDMGASDLASPVDSSSAGQDLGPTDSGPAGDSSVDTPCGPGYEGDPGNCTDIDECVAGTDDCDVNATCGNTVGAFTCACDEGWVGDGRACVPPTGCIADDECGSNATCAPVDNICLCDAGWTGDGLSCVDVDECANATHDCDANATCGNADGGFTCTCEPGWSGTGQACSDVDECMAGTDDCDSNATCANSLGAFSCSCNAGFTGAGTVCADVDECGATDDCDVNATCSNTPGSFVCTCNSGWGGDGKTCVLLPTCDPSDLDALTVVTPIANTGGSGPVFGAALSGGGAVLGWTDGSGVHLTEVDALGVPTGVQHDIAGTRLFGLAAHDTGWAVLVTRGTDELALVAVSPTGTVQFDETILGGVPHDVIGNEWFGSGIRRGRLTWTGSAWATYNTVQRLWPDNIAHYGDTLRYYDSTGAEQGGGWGWGCSHSMDVRIAHNGTRIGPVCSSDCFPSKGVHFDHRAQKLYDDPASNCSGGYATSLGGVTPVTDGFWVAFTATDMRQSHDVALVKVMNDASKGTITWFTSDAADDLYLHSAMYGSDLVLGWSTGGADSFIRADSTTGAAIGTASAVGSSELSAAGDFFVLANGEVAWPTRDANGVAFGRLTFCP